jgi:hypothetical protein
MAAPALKSGQSRKRAAGMRSQCCWVCHDQVRPVTSGQELGLADEKSLMEAGNARMTTGELGTEIKWHVNSPCVTSLFKVMQVMASAKPPFILRFHSIGWFEEVYAQSESATRRIEQVLARGDRHFTSRVFIQEADPRAQVVPNVLKQALTGQSVPDDFVVDCAFDTNSQMFRVDRVGASSAIGRVWGTYTSSHPCQSVGSYGDPVNATYEDVLRRGVARYDHVLAALRLPDNALHWVPYHRVVLPHRMGSTGQGVSVISQIARVDIQVL